MGACAAPLCHLPLLQKFNAMIYLPFREDARIVHMHGCVGLPADVPRVGGPCTRVPVQMQSM